MKPYRYEKFTAAIEAKIRGGIYKSGHKLPSVRTLMKEFSMSTGTVQQGYEYLMIRGLVESIHKSGYYVSNLPENQISVPGAEKKVIIRDAVFEHNLSLTTSLRAGRNSLTEFNVAAPGDLLIPQKLILRTMQQIIREQGAKLLRYYPSGGSVELKDNICRHAAPYNTNLNAGELIITDGALQALYIALVSVCAAGDIVAVESPCVFSVLQVIKTLQLKVIEIPMDFQTGFDIAYLKKACTGTAIKAIVVTPNFQNPTGLLLTDAQKKELLAVAQQYGIALIENDIYGDLYFNGQRPSNIKSFDESGLVMTYSSYAKTLAAGIRLGWLSAGQFLQKAEQVKFSTGSTVSPVYQETVNKLLSTDSYDRHLRTFRTQLSKNAYRTINLLNTFFPSGTKVIVPAGGYNIWVQLPERINTNDFYLHCEQVGVKFTPGVTFSFSNSFKRFFRIVFADQYSAKRIERLQLAGKNLE
ncbi:DNA-binding transcriptional MocR family regulator [Pedobacter cryoconitis]|uniref:DNA-binding transcriptional MocR family regulator n=1 Tax=Pedobacter cryoconitis TaxID=188932 RepID=A0A7W8ZPU6_9SPHI|nr:PLP-dependent aminotransferase family protein [Pedobacter cryoconitis]MBB5637727.1 DNA-binding transcriptional MocR family regulator [Pedobacter cryoconitis]